MRIISPTSAHQPASYDGLYSAEEQEWQGWEDNVIVHENLHASVGGEYAGAPEYDYELKPNGKYYIVSGEVKIDTSFDEAKPEDMLRKFDIVERSALAPSDPSSADLAVASEARGQKGRAAQLLSEKNMQPTSVFDDQPISLPSS